MRENNAGFSLIELLVAMFIIALISGLTIANYGSGQQKYYVSKSVQKFASDIRRAQNMALTGKTQGLVKPKGYGIHMISSSGYLFFYNTDSSKTYQGVNVLETVNLESNISITPASFDVYFASPEPTTYLNGANSGSQVFSLALGSYSKTVSVNSNGKIEIN